MVAVVAVVGPIGSSLLSVALFLRCSIMPPGTYLRR